jgi:hypothetical protein
MKFEKGHESGGEKGDIKILAWASSENYSILSWDPKMEYWLGPRLPIRILHILRRQKVKGPFHLWQTIVNFVLSSRWPMIILSSGIGS